MKIRQDNRWPIGVAFSMPLIGGLLALTIYPVVSSFYFSLCDYPILDPPRFVEVANYGGMVLYLAALQDVPQELYESAALDGATAWHRLLHITLPMISTVLLFTTIMGLIGTMQYFTQAWVMTGGGPNESTTFYGLKLFNS